MEISRAQIYLICKIGRSDKRKYQRNCAFSFKRKWTAWTKRKDKNYGSLHIANLAESDKGSFCNQRKWSKFYYGEFMIKSNLLVGNKYRASDFLKKQKTKESKFLLDTMQ